MHSLPQSEGLVPRDLRLLRTCDMFADIAEAWSMGPTQACQLALRVLVGHGSALRATRLHVRLPDIMSLRTTQPAVRAVTRVSCQLSDR